MTRSPLALTPAALILASALAVSGQSVYPTGTTIYEPARAWSGFTVLSPLNTPSAIVIDMNGTVVKRWEGYNNSAGGPARVLPGGDVIAAAGARPGRQESVEHRAVRWRSAEDQRQRIGIARALALSPRLIVVTMRPSSTRRRRTSVAGRAASSRESARRLASRGGSGAGR